MNNPTWIELLQGNHNLSQNVQELIAKYTLTSINQFNYTLPMSL